MRKMGLWRMIQCQNRGDLRIQRIFPLAEERVELAVAVLRAEASRKAGRLWIPMGAARR